MFYLNVQIRWNIFVILFSTFPIPRESTLRRKRRKECTLFPGTIFTGYRSALRLSLSMAPGNEVVASSTARMFQCGLTAPPWNIRLLDHDAALHPRTWLESLNKASNTIVLASGMAERDLVRPVAQIQMQYRTRIGTVTLLKRHRIATRKIRLSSKAE